MFWFASTTLWFNDCDCRCRAERAQRAFEKGRAGLFGSNGRQVYSEAEHAERLAALRSERNRALGEVEEELQAAFDKAKASITNLENRDPTELLTPDELARANEKRSFALDAAETLPVGALVRRLDAVLESGDAGSILAHWMGGVRRREKILEHRRASLESDPSSEARATLARLATATELDDVLDRMHGHLDGGMTTTAIEASRERLEELREVERITYLSRHETTRVYSPEYAVPGR